MSHSIKYRNMKDTIVEAGEYLEAVYDGIADSGVGGKGNTIKEKVYGKLFKEKGQKSHHYIKLEEKTIDGNGEIIEKDLNEKANRVQALVDSFAADLKYEGETPRILIGDLPPGVEAFASPENNTIAIDRKVLALADANKVLTLVGHELGHFNSYDANTESTAKRVEDAIQGTKNKGKYTEKLEKEFQEKYAGRDISGNEAQKVIEGISEESRENYYDKITHEEYKKENPTSEEIQKLAKKMNISEEVVKENYTKYAYYNALKEKNTIYNTKEEFEKSQKELKDQIAKEKDPIKREELSKKIYKKLPDSEALYHNIKINEKGEAYIDNSFPNEKYVNAQGEEAVFSKKTGSWIDDGINNATYNIGVWEKDLILRDLIIHMNDKKGDVNLWMEYGVGANDKLTKEQKKKLTEQANKIYFNKKTLEIAEEKLKNGNKNRK